MSKDCWDKNTLRWTAEVLYAGNFLLLPPLPQAKWFPRENCLDSLTCNPSIQKARGLVPEIVQSEQVTRAEWREKGMHWKWFTFPAFKGIWGLNLPHVPNKCCREWPEIIHLEWFWQEIYLPGAVSPNAKGWVWVQSRKESWGRWIREQRSVTSSAHVSR